MFRPNAYFRETLRQPRLHGQSAQALDQPLVVLAMVLASAALYVVLGLVGGALGAGIFQRANLPGADEG